MNERGCVFREYFIAWAQFPPQCSERLDAKADTEYEQGQQPKGIVVHSCPDVLFNDPGPTPNRFFFVGIQSLLQVEKTAWQLEPILSQKKGPFIALK